MMANPIKAITEEVFIMRMLRASAQRMANEPDLWQVIIERRINPNSDIWVQEEVVKANLSHHDALNLAGKLDKQYD